VLARRGRQKRFTHVARARHCEMDEADRSALWALTHELDKAYQGDSPRRFVALRAGCNQSLLRAVDGAPVSPSRDSLVGLVREDVTMSWGIGPMAADTPVEPH
jgi:hypothetical protein